MESRIMSLQNLSVVKYAVLLSLTHEIKREILCVPESEYSAIKLKYQYYRKEQWVAIIEKKVQELLKCGKLTEIFQDKVISLLPAIALRILIWSEYHEGILGLDRYYSLNFLKISHFTSQGVIDNKTAAEDMIRDAKLNVKQKYKLACMYCFKNHISSFFREIFRNKKNTVLGPEESKWMEKPGIVKYWTCQLMGVVHTSPQCFSGIEEFIESGSIEAVKYFLEQTPLISRGNALKYGVTKIVWGRNYQSDWIVFRDQRFVDSKESWTPSYFYVDILRFLLSNMTKPQQQEALKIHVRGISLHKITLFEFFLRWPYQDYFMKIAEILWDLISKRTYATILLMICDEIEPCKRENLFSGEEKSYDYKKLLVDFWSQSPDHFKRYVLLNSPITYWNLHVPVATTTGIGLLVKLLSLRKFTCEDKEIIWLILGSATSEERVNLTSAKQWSSTCISILKKEKFEIFDRLLLLLCKSEQEASEFKKKLNLHEISKSICIDFLKFGKVNAVKSLINRISLPESRLWTLKEKIIYSYEGMQHCRKLLSSNRYKDFEEFIKWFLPSNFEEIVYKRELASKVSETFPVHHFTESEMSGFLTSFTTSKVPNRETKTSFANKVVRTICESLIAGSSVKVFYEENNSSIQVKCEFTGGQFGRVDKFLMWCISNEMKMADIKFNLYKLAGTDIHFQLIKARQWKVAKRFLEWALLSLNQIRAFKRYMIFNHDGTRLMFHYLVFEQDDEMHNLVTIDLFLRWHLEDKKSIIEFRDYFFDTHLDCDEAGLKKLNLLIENYLDDLERSEKCQICGRVELRFLRILVGGCAKGKRSVFPPRIKRRYSEYEVENEDGSFGRRRSLRLLNKSQKKL